MGVLSCSYLSSPLFLWRYDKIVGYLYFLIYFYFVERGVEHYPYYFEWCFLVFHCFNKQGSAVTFYPIGLVFMTTVYLLLTQLATRPVQPGQLPFQYTPLLPPKYNMSNVCGSEGFYTHRSACIFHNPNVDFPIKAIRWLCSHPMGFTYPQECVHKQAYPSWNLCSIYFKGG